MTITVEREQQITDEAMRDLVRSFHDDLDLPDGFRAEIIGGIIVVSPTPFWRHAYIVKRLGRAIDAALMPDHEVFENITVETAPGDDRYVPDLSAWPTSMMIEADSDRRWIAPLADCVFAAEVTSPNQETRDYDKAAAYARGGVPIYLLVDRKTRKCVVYTEPTSEGYENQHTVPFGRPLILAFEGGSEAVIDTSTF